MASLDELDLSPDERRFLGLPPPHIIDLTTDDDDGQPTLVPPALHLPCQICRDELADLDIQHRQRHYDAHFNDLPEPTLPSLSRPTHRLPDRENIFWSPHDPIASLPASVSPAPTSLLKRALIKTHHSGATVNAVLCRDGVCHVKTELFDMSWGCGYRNFMMACTALVAQDAQPSYRELVRRNGDLPGVRMLQEWLEDAWTCGYDRPGALHFKNRLSGTRKWIGTSDLYVVFAYLGIPARLVDFRKTGDAPRALAEWIKSYFTPSATPSRGASAFDMLQSSPIVTSNKLPIILQHAGHSRTVIGYECDRKHNINLLVLDPAKTFPPDMRREAISTVSGIAPPSPVKGTIGALATKLLKRPLAEEEDSRRMKRSKDDQGSPMKASPEKGGNASKTVSWFRVSMKDLNRKDEYQVLYFTMEAALSISEQERRKVVMSEIGC